MKAKLQQLIDVLNRGFKTGDVQIMDLNDSNFADFGCLPDDIIIYVDFNDEDEPAEGLTLREYERALEMTDQFMLSNGYEEVVEHDGSGGGLYYGFSAYRKKV